MTEEPKYIHEKGEAKKDLIDMSPEERYLVAMRIFLKVIIQTLTIGQLPIVNGQEKLRLQLKEMGYPEVLAIRKLSGEKIREIARQLCGLSNKDAAL